MIQDWRTLWSTGDWKNIALETKQQKLEEETNIVFVISPQNEDSDVKFG